MQLMFVDESGDLAPLPAGASTTQPVLAILGLMVPHEHVSSVTRQWVALKRTFFPGLCSPGAKPFDWHRAEVKGADLRRLFRTKSSRNERRHAIGFLDKTLALAESHRCRYSARVWVKEPGRGFNGTACYSFSVQALCADFQRKLDLENTHGLVIADSRMPGPNSLVSHSVFTHKYRAAGDPFSRLLEAPVFGHSDNHACLQVADMLASALLFPICAHYFLNEKIMNSHIESDYPILAHRYSARLKRLQFRFESLRGACGGLVVSDPVGGRGAARLFRHFAAPSVVTTVRGRECLESTSSEPPSASD